VLLAELAPQDFRVAVVKVVRVEGERGEPVVQLALP
jgi:hypothetical protein